MGGPTGVRVLAAGQLAGGGLLLARPHAVADALRSRAGAPSPWVVRLLGGRLLAQGGATLARPTRGIAGLGAGVDLAHGLSMLLAAGVDRRYRRAGPVSAAAALGSALVYSRAARSPATDR